MSSFELIQIILTSSLVAGLISAIVSYFISIRLKRFDFKNEYYKEILKKRLKAYQYIENQISVLKAVVLGEDKKPYHSIFSFGEEKFYEFQKDLAAAISSSLWIDEKTNEELQKLNDLFFNLNNKIHSNGKQEMEEVGKLYYDKISNLRFSLENSVKNGLYDLHDVKKAFRVKKNNTPRVIIEE
jgi:hypothetical protein